MKLCKNVLELIGNTPIVKLNRMVGEADANVYVKMESQNPGGSIKDRIALYILEELEKSRKIQPGDTIVEPTSGNTGIGLCMVCAVKGYRAIIVMPENMSEERKKMMRAYGAELVMTPKNQGMAGAIEKANELVEKNDGYQMLDQFHNINNPKTHEKFTSKEILDQMDGKLDCLVAGIGTGGTITGVGAGLKAFRPDIEICGVEPKTSAVLSGGSPGAHGIQGIGAGFIPSILNQKFIDRILPICEQDAKQTSREMARQEGIFVGISAGAAVFAGIQRAKELGKNKNVLVIIPDGGEKYMSTDLFE